MNLFEKLNRLEDSLVESIEDKTADVYDDNIDEMLTEAELTAREKLIKTFPDDFGHWSTHSVNKTPAQHKIMNDYARDPNTLTYDNKEVTTKPEMSARDKLLKTFPDLDIRLDEDYLKEDMSRNVRKFVENNIAYIDFEDWDELVNNAYTSLFGREIEELFNILKVALGIDIKVTENKDGTVSVTVDKKEVTPVEKPKQKIREPEVKKEQPKVQPKPQLRQPVGKPEPKVTQPTKKKDEVKDPELVARISAWNELATKLKEFANNHKTGSGSYAIPLSMYITPNKNELTATTNELDYGFKTINELDQEVKHPLGKTTYANNKFDVDLTQIESKYQQITKQRQRTWAYKGPRK